MPRPRAEHGGERGASALEFALVLPIFLLLLLGIVQYGMIFALEISLTVAAREGARAAVAADPLAANFETLVATRSRAAVTGVLGWLPAAQQAIVLGSNGAKVGVTVTHDATLGTLVTVDVSYPNYAQNPLIPTITLPGLGSLPPVPSKLGARSTATL